MRRFVTKLAKNGNALFVAVPRDLLNEMQLRRGDHVAVTKVGDAIVIVPIERALTARFSETAAAMPADIREALAR